MIFNKSNHPVEIKKISVRIWCLRDEIEAAIGRRIKECEAAGVPLYIDDIKKFYNLNLDTPLTEQDNVIPLHRPKEDSDGVTDLMESLQAEEKNQAEATKTFNEAEDIMAKQKIQGLETTKPNPIISRPYDRQAPDLDKISYGFTFLSDVNMDFILCFTKDKFLQGQSIVIEFLIPKSFMMSASIAYCHHYAIRSKIISVTKPDYRVQCKFNFSISGERDTLRNFLKSVEPNLPPPKKAKKTKEDDSFGL